MTFGLEDILEVIHHKIAYNFRGIVRENQYVGTVKVGEEEFEEVLKDNGVEYNIGAYWKRHHVDDRDSTGSWRITWWTNKNYVEPGMQIHFTLFHARSNPEHLDVYAHYEDDWSWSFLSAYHHLRETNFDTEEGVRRARGFFNDIGVSIYDTH